MGPRADFEGSMEPFCLLMITSMAKGVIQLQLLACLNATLSQPSVLYIQLQDHCASCAWIEVVITRPSPASSSSFSSSSSSSSSSHRVGGCKDVLPSVKRAACDPAQTCVLR